MPEVLHYDPRRAGHTAATSPRKKEPYWERSPEPPRITFEDPGARTYDPESRTWMTRLPEPELALRPEPVALPAGDGSGVFWEVREWSWSQKRYGQVMWVIEAASLESAIAEKVRLCLGRGWRPGWGRIKGPVEPG